MTSLIEKRCFLDNIFVEYQEEGVIVFSCENLPIYKVTVNIYNGKLEAFNFDPADIPKNPIIHIEDLTLILAKYFHMMGLHSQYNRFQIDIELCKFLQYIEEIFGNYKKILYVVNEKDYYKYASINDWMRALEEKEIDVSLYDQFIDNCFNKILQILQGKYRNLSIKKGSSEHFEQCQNRLDCIHKLKMLHSFQFYCLEKPSIFAEFASHEESLHKQIIKYADKI